MQTREDPQLLRQYLLGSLDELRQEQIEERLLDDEKLQAELADVQHDLIDDHVFGHLTARERTLFDQNFVLSPERLHMIRLAQAWRRYGEEKVAAPSETPTSKGFTWRAVVDFLKTHEVAAGASAAVLLALLGYGLWNIYERQQLEARLAQLQTQRLAVERELARLNTGQLPDQPASIAIVTLRPLLRDLSDTNRVSINDDTDFLQLRLELIDDEFTVYKAIIETNEGQAMYTLTGLKAKTSDARKTIILNLPGRVLPPGDYQVHLLGITIEEVVDAGIYPFQVVFN